MATKKILIINGPNLNLLGTREPSIYGSESFEHYFQQKILPKYPQVTCYQSNHEGDIIDRLQEAVAEGSTIRGIVLNAGAYSHTSPAIADAIRAIALPTVEVHLSNIFARESFRHRSYLSSACRGMICGFGLKGYLLAVEALEDLFSETK